jgi:alkylation response protein AidB-like acyl-CoA dehydrogenase
MDFALDDEQRLMVATIRKLVDRDVRGWAASADRDGAPPARLLDVAGDVGFLIDAVPENYDGLLDGPFCHLDRALRGLELGRGCAGLSAVLETNVEPALATARWGSETAQTALFSALADGALAAFAHDSRGRLDVHRVGSAVRLTGELGPIPALAGASHLLLSCRADDDDEVIALVPTPSFDVEPKTPSGWRAARWGTATFDATTVEAAWILPGADPTEVLAWAHVSLAARAVGVCTAAMEHAKAYADERIQFGRPIGQFQSLARLRDAAETRTAAARALVLEAAWKIDARAADAADAASRARDFAADAVATTTIDAVQIFGGYGFVNDYPVEKLMRDARAFDVLHGNQGLERTLAAVGA